jgi:hypothetical protein
MDPALVGLIGVVVGALAQYFAQYFQTRRERRLRQEESFREAKLHVYSKYLRAIDASYAQAVSGQGHSEDINIRAATAEIEMLSIKEIADAASALTNKVIEVHSSLPDSMNLVDECNRERLSLVKLFRTDVGIDKVIHT